MEKGWIKLYRKLDDSRVWRTANNSTRVVLIELLINATHKEYTKKIRGGEKTVLPGQLHMNAKIFCHKCDLTYKQFSDSLDWLAKENVIGLSREAGKGTLVTILNWGKYQTDLGIDFGTDLVTDFVTDSGTVENPCNDRVSRDFSSPKGTDLVNDFVTDLGTDNKNIDILEIYNNKNKDNNLRLEADFNFREAMSMYLALNKGHAMSEKKYQELIVEASKAGGEWCLDAIEQMLYEIHEEGKEVRNYDGYWIGTLRNWNKDGKPNNKKILDKRLRDFYLGMGVSEDG